MGFDPRNRARDLRPYSIVLPYVVTLYNRGASRRPSSAGLDIEHFSLGWTHIHG